jgi:hypothetical protein
MNRLTIYEPLSICENRKLEHAIWSGRFPLLSFIFKGSSSQKRLIILSITLGLQEQAIWTSVCRELFTTVVNPFGIIRWFINDNITSYGAKCFTAQCTGKLPRESCLLKATKFTSNRYSIISMDTLLQAAKWSTVRPSENLIYGNTGATSSSVHRTSMGAFNFKRKSIGPSDNNRSL